MIERLINILRNAGFEDITAVEVAEMILLADFLPAPVQPVAGPQVPESTEPVVETPASPENEAGAPQDEPPRDATPETSDPPAVNIYDETAVEAEGAGLEVVPFRTPAANALPGAQKIARALRPLRRRYPSARRFVLDEERTVRRIADCGLFSPVMRPAPENWLEAALVFDESVSMRVWRETLDQLERLFERCGYFRDVRSWRLNTEGSEAKIFRESSGQIRLERRPGELLDPARRRLIVLVSDCLGPAWRSGAAFRLAHGWAANGPVALVQTLPRCFWAGTTMTPVDAVLRTPKPGAPNRLLQIAPAWYGEIAEAGGVAMPILTLDEWSIAPWAQSVAGAGGVVVSGLMVPPPDSMLAEDSASSNGLEGDPGSQSAAERIDGFFHAATHEAKRLACYLASVPLSLPVMRLVQQTMLPGSRQTHLAEVFLSGLLYQTTMHREQDEILYEFYDGVREELRRRVTEAETERVIYQVSRFIESRIGESGDFEALLAVPAVGGAVRRLDPLSRRFASLSAEILKRSGRREAIVQKLERLAGPDVAERHTEILTPGVYIEELPHDLKYTPLEECLLDLLNDEAAAQIASRFEEMTSIEAIREMHEAGVVMQGEVLLSRRDPLAQLLPEGRYGQIVYRLLFEAARRCRVIKSAADLQAMIPPNIVGAALRQEAERIKQDIQSALGSGGAVPMMRATGRQRTAAIRAAVELHDRFSGGVLLVDLDNRAVDHYEVMHECAAPFLNLRVGRTEDPLLLINQFELLLGRDEYLIILDKTGDFREMSNLNLSGGKFIIAIDRVIDPLPNRSAVEARLREARGNYDRLSAQLQAIRQERDLVKMPAPQLRTNLEIQRRTFLQDIRECESQLRGLERDPVVGLAELVQRVVLAPGSSLGAYQSAIESIVAELRNADSEAREAVLLRNLGEQFASLKNHAVASEFYKFALDREPRDLSLHINTLESLGMNLVEMSQDESAIAWLQRALENAETVEDLRGRTRISFRLSEIHKRLQRPALDPVLDFQTFTYTTVRLNAQGRELERRSLSARQLIEELGEGVRLEMVELSGGPFLMGLGDESMDWGVREYSRHAKKGEEDADQWFLRHTPRNRVVVPSFLIGKFTVTQGQWQVVASWEPIERRLDPTPSHFQFYPDHPVENICWDEAWEFCARLRRQTGRNYRLPSEAEWEYACRAGTTSPFAFGDTITPEFVNYNGLFPCADAPGGVNRERTVPVGSLGVANSFGLFDMHGNVWEWCDDTWHDDYLGAPTDGRPWISTSRADRGVLRGGSWWARAFRCSSSFRLSEERSVRAFNFGLRVVLDIQPQGKQNFSTDEHR